MICKVLICTFSSFDFHQFLNIGDQTFKIEYIDRTPVVFKQLSAPIYDFGDKREDCTQHSRKVNYLCKVASFLFKCL